MGHGLQAQEAGGVSVRQADGSSGITDGLSVDVEDYFQVEAFAHRVPRSQWPSFPSRVRQNTERVLHLLDRNRCRATFFILGWVAEREPALVREVAQAGHEVACHSHLHRRVHSLTPQEFREDTKRARGVIEEAAGVSVVGFRAPTFSITRESLWALEILAELGFKYDSSIFPVRHDLYGIFDAPRGVHQRRLPSGQSIWEFPASTVRVAGQNLPAAGGGYLRLLPMTYTRWAINRIHNQERRPVMVYFHPWELDPGQPRLKAGWRSRLRHYTGLGKTEDRLDALLSNGRFQPLRQLLQEVEQPTMSAQAGN
jgi:polysaccharide deacetylase family protein (PEP-CTERM system associated)